MSATPRNGKRTLPLLLRNAGALEHRGPFAAIGGKSSLQLLGRACPGFDPKLGVALLHLSRTHDLANGLVQDIDDLRRRVMRSEHPVPRNDLVSRDSGFG